MKPSMTKSTFSKSDNRDLPVGIPPEGPEGRDPEGRAGDHLERVTVPTSPRRTSAARA